MLVDPIKNNLIKMFNNNRDFVNHEVSRLGSVDHRATTYRRNGMLNFGSRQMMGISADSEVYTVGVGGHPVVG